MQGSVATRWGNYHKLDGMANDAFCCVYSNESLVHATKPTQVRAEFCHVLKPDGRIVLYKYDHIDVKDAPDDCSLARSRHPEQYSR